MPNLTLKPADVVRFSDFLRENGLKQFYLAKDHGAYIGANVGKFGTDTFKNITFYFKGCDPAKDAEFYDNARDKFGGDDFGEHLEADIVHRLAVRGKGMLVRVTPTQIAVGEA